jgi:hypothetical protein
MKSGAVQQQIIERPAAAPGPRDPMRPMGGPRDPMRPMGGPPKAPQAALGR